MKLTSLTLSALLATLFTTCHARKKDDAVLLSKVKSLTLRDGRDTTHRRVQALPQLSCVGGDAMGLYQVDVMRCENSGSEYDVEDIQWTCKASLPADFKLGSTEVICEGYDSPDDPYVLKGSCAVEYRLVLTETGQQKYPDQFRHSGSKHRSGANAKGGDETVAAVIFWIIFGAIVIAILYSIFWSGNGRNGPRNRAQTNFRPGWGGGGGGGGPGGNDDPPPPYTPRASKPKQSSSTRSSGGWRPGFWSGTAAGAAAGYAAGSYNANRNQRSSRDAAPRAGPSNVGASPSFGSSSYASSSRHESTGFGGTTRR